MTSTAILVLPVSGHLKLSAVQLVLFEHTMAIVPRVGACTCTDDTGTNCIVFNYKNSNLSYDATLYLLSNDEQIGFMSTTGFSGWHGRFRYMQHETLLLEFNYKGDMHKLRTTMLMKTSPDSYYGSDYRGREITLTFKYSMIWCPRCKLWRM